MEQGVRPSAGEPAIGWNDQECLALGEMAVTEEGDAFPTSAGLWDAALLMPDGPCRTCSLGMRRPYRQAVPG